MNLDLTRPQSPQELYKTYFSFASKFKFTDLMKNYIQSEEWKDKSQDAIWKLLSNISDDIGAVLTDEIVNYTRNVVDVNTCKVPQLIEHAQMLSYGLDHIRNSYAFFPRNIQCLVDIFSINPEYLIGNGKNHILSDATIKELLSYIRRNLDGAQKETNRQFLDRLIDDPHGLLNATLYKRFIQLIFHQTIVNCLKQTYSNQDDPNAKSTEPMAFNMLWKERDNQLTVISNLKQYRTWLDKFISNEIEHPLNSEGLANTLWQNVEMVKSQKKMSSQFNPFKVADHIWFNGLNPNHQLSDDELALVQDVLDYHARGKYDYRNQRFVDDASTQYAYYKELEFCEYVKLVLFVMNNLNSFSSMTGLAYDTFTNKFIMESTEGSDCIHVPQIFYDGLNVVENSNGEVALSNEIMMKVSWFLCDYVFLVQDIRENMKTIALKHAMRGSGALLAHVVNDYLIKELPKVRDLVGSDLKFRWETDNGFRNYANVKILEYEDDNEYFNIEPEKDVRFTERTNARYWEQLYGMGDDDSLGVLTKGQIKNFYRNVLGMGTLQPQKPKDYDDVMDFLVDLFKIGANPIGWDSSERVFSNPLDDIERSFEEDYGYTKQERMDVQQNTQLRVNQEKQFLEYSGSDDVALEGLYDYMNNRLSYWKNTDYSSHMLHPFMYNLKLWNRLNNIIINGYKNYVDNDLIGYLTSKVRFDELFGEYGECKNFWKYNVMDLTGYTTRYEAAVKDEHRDDTNKTVSELTGYDGLFYPKVAKEFLETYKSCLDDDGQEIEDQFTLPNRFFNGEIDPVNNEDDLEYLDSHPFISAIYSIYMQSDDDQSFYTKWYSHLNWTRTEYQKMALQLWYWRKRVVELISSPYPIAKYCLDIQGNSLILVQTFDAQADEKDPYLIDLAIAQNDAQERSGNHNTNVAFCDSSLKRPSELWIRWKSSPIALPAFDVLYDQKVDGGWFDQYYRTQKNVELGQITHTNSICNDSFKVVIKNWRNSYGNFDFGNKLPVFFDMEQSANVIALASWNLVPELDESGEQAKDSTGNDLHVTCCGKNPYHILSVEQVGDDNSEYSFTKYSTQPTDGASRLHQDWMFDAYHYCQADGSILIPLYAFNCEEPSKGNAFGQQALKVKMFLVAAQTMKSNEFAAKSKLEELVPRHDTANPGEIDLNKATSFNGMAKLRFDHHIKVCRNTNVVFCPYDFNGANKLRIAFLGQFQDGQGASSFKISSCEAKTRYEFDSQSTKNLALLKGNYFKGDDILWGGTRMDGRRYKDDDLAKQFNSYDSMDKYVFMLEFQPSLDNKSLFEESSANGMKCASYNILSDAGCIPHFTYQSLVKYGDSDGGTAYVWCNPHLGGKDHLMFELLGISDQYLPDAFANMSRMVVDDIVDECKTLICPAKLMDDIYRIWCEAKGVKRKLLPGEEDPYGYKAKYESYFENEYKDYTSPELDFGGDSCIEWSIDDDDLFEAEHTFGESTMDEYFVTVLRTKDGQILNEKRYLLPPTPISKLLVGESDDGYTKCKLSKWQSAQINGDHFVPAQTIFTGTQNPFTYDGDGNHMHTRAVELQYGNSICGVDSLEIKIDIVKQSGIEYVKDENGYVVHEPGEDGNDIYSPNGTNNPTPKTKDIERMFIKPTLRFKKNELGISSTLDESISHARQSIPEGEVTVIVSHKNLDNIAKYHILNATSNLYFGGSLPKNGKNQFKFSDFKFDKTVKLAQDGDGWKSEEDNGETLSFSLDDVKSANEITDEVNELPPYYIETDNGTWFLEQSRESIVKTELETHEFPNKWVEGNETKEDIAKYKIPQKGDFVYAHRVKSKPEKYLDYLYVNRGGLQFKISEESESFGEAMSKVPPFHIDEVLKNKMQDLNDIQMLQEFSTFIHQSENPSKVEGCGSFNPLFVDAILKHGIEQKNGEDENGSVVICANEVGNKAIQLSNNTSSTQLALQLEDGEIDDLLKIYTNYVRVDDGYGDFHYDLYFNVQNLFNSPFEYISSITKQPNVLIIPDSYLYLSGDKFINKVDHNEIDQNKVKKIHEGGTLSIYGQVKTYCDDVLSDAKTIKLFTFQVHNVSDDKPKFLIKKTYDITQNTLGFNSSKTVELEFVDVLHTIDEKDGITELNKEVTVIQPLNVHCDWDGNDDYRINSISFDIKHDIIDFNNVPELHAYDRHTATLRKDADGNPYYDRWSDNCMTLKFDPETGIPRLTLTFEKGVGYNFETIYLRWKLPKGFKTMDTLDRLGGYIFKSTAENIHVECNNASTTPKVEVKTGHVVARMKERNSMYLGIEHSTTLRKSGYVLKRLGEKIKEALLKNKEEIQNG